MLLKMRGLPPRTQANSEDGILSAVEGSDEAAIRWFDSIKVSSKIRPDPHLHRNLGYQAHAVRRPLS